MNLNLKTAGYRLSLLRSAGQIAHQYHKRPRNLRAITRNLHTFPSKQRPPEEPFKILFFGRDEFSCIAFKELYSARDVWEEIWIATHPDNKTGRRGTQLSVSPLKTLGESLQIPVHTIPADKSVFKSWKPPAPFAAISAPPLNHLLLTASFGRILSSPLLQLFGPTRRLNVHPSLLPSYRGPAPIQHTLLRGEPETGVCVIELMERRMGIDAGAIWGCKKLPIPDEITFPQLRDILAREGGKLLVSVLRDLLAGRATSTPQATTQSVFDAPLITAADAIVDPTTMTAEEIVRRHRAISHQKPLVTYLPTRKTLQLHSPSVYRIPSEATPDVFLPQTPGTAVYCPATRALLVRCASQSSFDSESSFSISSLHSSSFPSILRVPHVKQEGRALLGAKEWWNGAKGTGMGIVQNGIITLSGVSEM